jgi:hypothetical protein
MTLASYFHRSAVAASQVLGGFDEEAIEKRLDRQLVGLRWGQEAVSSREGEAILDLTVRLLARLYPRLSLRGPGADGLQELAGRINNSIEVDEGAAEIELVVGEDSRSEAHQSIYVGGHGWDARVSTQTPQGLGRGTNPMGAGAAACIGAANLFRAVFLEDSRLDNDLVLSTLDVAPASTSRDVDVSGLEVLDRNVLVGAGAVGNAAAWVLGRLRPTGELHLVDHERIEESNLQRYVLAEETDIDGVKVDLLASRLEQPLRPIAHPMTWAQFTESCGYEWERVMVALDSAADRRAVQASLPRWIANAWTQPGDLGVSTHSWREGACLSCLYLPDGAAPSEDQLIAGALGVDDDQHRLQIRGLLHTNAAPPPQLLEEAAVALGVEAEQMRRYAGRPLRELYTEGICGGAVLPLDRLGRPNQAVHVPLAHQSALAGVLLAGRFLAAALGEVPVAAAATRVDVLRAIPKLLTQPLAKNVRGLCICQDRVYQAAYDEKYPA